MNFLCGRRRCGGRLTTLRAAAPDPAAPARQRAEALPADVSEAAGNEEEDEEVLEPEGHERSVVKELGNRNRTAGLTQGLDHAAALDNGGRRVAETECR